MVSELMEVIHGRNQSHHAGLLVYRNARTHLFLTLFGEDEVSLKGTRGDACDGKGGRQLKTIITIHIKVTVGKVRLKDIQA